MNLKFHHTGIAVDSIQEAKAAYISLFGENSISEIYHITSQQVNVCFVDLGNHTYLELIEPASDESSIHRLRKKGITYYHTAFITPDIEASVKEMEENNFKPMHYFHSEAFAGKRCIFLFSPDAHLIELIEK